MAKKIDFTIRTIEALKTPEAGRAEYKDAKTPGLYLRVTASGVKSFSLVGRAKGANKIERLTLGKFPAVKPEEARRLATEYAGTLASGKSLSTAAQVRRGELSLAELYALYLAHIKRTTKRPASVENTWKLYIEPEFGRRRLSDVTALQVERWHLGLPEQIVRRRAALAEQRQAERQARRDAIASARAVRRRGPDPKPAIDQGRAPIAKITGQRTANAALEALRAMYYWALEPKRAHFVGVNPASKHDMFAIQSRERFLQPDELAPFFQALAEEPNASMRDFFLIALLTGARRSNVAAMRWDGVSLDRAEWRVAGAQMKNGQPQTITLAPEAVLLLKARLEQSSSPFVFPSTRSKSGHMIEPKAAWGRVCRRAGLHDIRVHDLRRTLGSWQARTGASLVLIGKSLNHQDSQSTAVYARLDLDPVRQSVDRATSAMFEAAGLKTAATVAPITKRRPKREAA